MTETVAAPAPLPAPTPAPTPALTEAAARSLDRALVRSIAWNGVAKWTTQAATWLSTIAVARLLSPADYGLVGMATIFTGFVAMLSEFGLGTAIVTLRELDRRQIAQVNGLSVLIGLASFATAMAAAGPLGRFFVPEVTTIVMVLSVTLVLGALRVVPNALLQRELRFKLLSLIEAGQALTLAAVTLLLAWLGFGYWALVVALLGGSVISTGAALLFAGHSFAWPRSRSLRVVAKFSWHVIASRVCWYVYGSSDFAVAGRLLGATALGHYTMARTMASAPLEKLTGLIASVTPAFFSTVQNDRAALRRYLLLITEGLSLVTLPATIGLALVAPDFVAVVLGEKWAMAVLPLQLLAVYAAVQSVILVVPQMLLVTGQTRFAMWVNVAMAVALPCGFVLGSRWGAPGIAAAWVVLYPLLSIPLLARLFTTIGMRPGEYARALWPALSSVAFMVLVLEVAAPSAGTIEPGAASLAIRIALGGGAYLAAVWLLHRERVAHARVALAYLRG